MCEKTIKLSLEQARKMYKKSPEMDELLLANFSKEELTGQMLPKSWYEVRPTGGYRISCGYNDTRVEKLPEMNTFKYDNKAIFATEKQAKSALAMAQLSQLMKAYNGDWEPNRSNGGIPKYVIFRQDYNIKKDTFYNAFQFLTLKTPELRDEFLKNFEGLIKQYFMLD